MLIANDLVQNKIKEKKNSPLHLNNNSQRSSKKNITEILSHNSNSTKVK